MSTICRLPDLAKTFKMMKIIDQLPTKADHNTLFGASIINACLTKQQPAEIIKMIRQSAEDNYSLVAAVIGEDLTNEIINF